MKIKRFVGKGVRGYMNFDIEFRDSVTFLIGINGSGKTTVLKLLSGLLTPSFENLAEIEFSHIFVECTRLVDNEPIYIGCDKKDGRLILTFINKGLKYSDKIDYQYPILGKMYDDERGLFNQDKKEQSVIEFENTEVVQQIKNLKNPLILGLSRRPLENLKSNEYLKIRRSRPQYEFKDYVDIALMDIQDLIYFHIRRNARYQYQMAEDFRRNVIKDSLIFHPLPLSNSFENTDFKKELKQLPVRKEKLLKAADDMEIDGVAEQIEPFFDELYKILSFIICVNIRNEHDQQELGNSLAKWIFYRTQLERIDNFIKYGAQYSDRLARRKEPIDRFVQSVNLFFKESNKEIIINAEGEVKVKTNENNRVILNKVFELSSGEKQLIVILAHLSFYKSVGNSPMFIIDEPELSLHISWQEIFVDALLKASPDTQFILATHSPSILSKLERRSWCVDLSKHI